MSPALRWFDAHLDLAYVAEGGRDMLAPPDRAGGPHPPAALTFPSLREGRVAACLGTIFTEPGGDGPVTYPPGDAAAANHLGLRQLEWYERWARQGVITLGLPNSRATEPLALAILMEGADPILSPDDLPWWVSRGIIAIGLTWARSSRYAGGNSTDEGLTDLGRAMIRAMDDLAIFHDLSHLSDSAMDELLTLTDRPVFASHSNCRALLDGKNQRHLRDDSIREIARRGGVIGLNLVRNFIRPGLNRDDPDDRPSIDDTIRHVEHICEITGHRRAVGLGSDLDGGISANDLPAGIDAPRDYARLADALASRAWPDADIRAFAFDNWARFFGR